MLKTGFWYIILVQIILVLAFGTNTKKCL